MVVGYSFHPINYERTFLYRVLKETVLPKAYSWAGLCLLIGLGYQGDTHNETGI